MIKIIRLWTAVQITLCLNLTALPLHAQILPLPQQPAPTPQNPPAFSPQSPLLNPSLPPSRLPQVPSIQNQFKVKRFVFVGNTLFSTRELERFVSSFIGKEITFNELQQAVSSITKHYTDAGYINSGAFIPVSGDRFRLQRNASVVTIQIIEGKVGTIYIKGTPRLRRYVRSRLRVAVSPVLNSNRLQEGLRLLQVNPLIKVISANLTPNPQPGVSDLTVRVTANPTISVQPDLNNERSPLVGTFERRLDFVDTNLFGLGDGLNLTYRNTEGSNAGQASYIIPLNPHNATLQIDYANVHSNIVERPFNQLNISEIDRSYQVTLRQPLLQAATDRSVKKFAVGLTGSREEGDERLLGIPFPLSPGADDRGRTRISAVRFFQDWNQRSNQEVLLIRSQFSLGIGALDATIHRTAPDSRFFIWQGQAAWLRRLNNRNLALLTRVNVQLATRPLVPFDQFDLGGVSTVRGYRQDALLTDDGVFGSIELRFPIIERGIHQLHVGPFIDAGYGFNVRGRNPSINTLLGTGLAIEYQLEDRLRIRLDYGIPVIAYPNQKRTLQENGLYLNLSYSL